MRERYAACHPASRSEKGNVLPFESAEANQRLKKLATRMLSRGGISSPTPHALPENFRQHHTQASCQKSILCGVCLGTRPTRKHEGDLVDEVCNVVGHIEEHFVHGSEEVAKQVARRVNGPAHRDDEAHVAESGRDGRTAILDGSTCFAREDLEEDEAPPAHAKGETNGCWECSDLAQVSEKEHHDGATEEPPEHSRACVLASGLEDQVKLDHLQRDGDGPVDITVNDGGLVNLNPVLTHVHVMHASHPGNQTAHVQARFPVVADGSCFREEEHCCCDHGDGDDPERDCNTIMWLPH